MAIDFGALDTSGGARPIDPVQIFDSLPTRPFSYLRDPQGQVLRAWFERRAEPDLPIRMNTGAGKTTVGLLCLQSSLNEGIGPAAYFTASRFLANQVMSEAAALGLATTEDPRSADYRTGEAILVTNIYKLVNGRSVFGVGHRSIDIGTLVIDDAHACMTAVESQFNLMISRGHKAYPSVMALIMPSVRDQAPATAMTIEDGSGNETALVPFWAWENVWQDALAILHEHKDDGPIGWSWPLIADQARECICIVSSEAIEIFPPALPIDRIPSFSEAKRRIYLSATMSEDGLLVTDFGADIESASKPLAPRSAADMGTRMILCPTEIAPDIQRHDLQAWIAELATSVNVVVIVPSDRRADDWKEFANSIVDTNSIDAGVEELRRGHVGLLVLVNRYDGIDLPDDACRVLVVDGLPRSTMGIDRLASCGLSADSVHSYRQIHRLEQGMGRGVRSTDDYCLVLCLGHELVEAVTSPSKRPLFSPATRVQLDLSRQIAKQLGASGMAGLREAASSCLADDLSWRRASRSALSSVKHAEDLPVPALAIARREAYELAQIGQHKEAAGKLNDLANSLTDDTMRSWVKTEVARYVQRYDPVEAQEILLSAIRKTRTVVPKPLAGVQFRRLQSQPDSQDVAAARYLLQHLSDPTRLLIRLNTLADELEMPGPDANRFESAIEEIGLCLGLSSARPEKETGKGPDNLWGIGGNSYLVIECKNGATANRISRSDLNQLGGSMRWFRNNYGEGASATAVIVHPATSVADQDRDHLVAGMRVVNGPKLERLRRAFRDYATGLAAMEGVFEAGDVRELQERLQLRAAGLATTFGVML